MLEDLFISTRDLPESRIVTVEVEGENGYRVTNTLRGLRAYQLPQEEPPPIATWEYEELFFPGLDYEGSLSYMDIFNRKGWDGWELIHCDYERGRAIFKRPR